MDKSNLKIVTEDTNEYSKALFSNRQISDGFVCQKNNTLSTILKITKHNKSLKQSNTDL